jgi:hypothetical protein
MSVRRSGRMSARCGRRRDRGRLRPVGRRRVGAAAGVRAGRPRRGRLGAGRRRDGSRAGHPGGRPDQPDRSARRSGGHAAAPGRPGVRDRTLGQVVQHGTAARRSQGRSRRPDGRADPGDRALAGPHHARHPGGRVRRVWPPRRASALDRPRPASGASWPGSAGRRRRPPSARQPTRNWLPADGRNRAGPTGCTERCSARSSAPRGALYYLNSLRTGPVVTGDFPVPRRGRGSAKSW